MKKRFRSTCLGKPRIASYLALALLPCPALLLSAPFAGQTVTIDGGYSGLPNGERSS